MTAQDAAWIALHEITHAIFDLAPTEKHRRFQSEIQSAPGGPTVYAYLNEALATGMQLLLYKRLGIQDRDPYNHPYIPRLGRATIPLLEAAIEDRRSIFDGFAQRYLQAGLAEMNERERHRGSCSPPLPFSPRMQRHGRSFSRSFNQSAR